MWRTFTLYHTKEGIVAKSIPMSYKEYFNKGDIINIESKSFEVFMITHRFNDRGNLMPHEYNIHAKEVE